MDAILNALLNHKMCSIRGWRDRKYGSSSLYTGIPVGIYNDNGTICISLEVPASSPNNKAASVIFRIVV